MGGQSLQINFYWNTAHIYFSVLFVVVGFIGLLTQRLSALAKREMFPTWAFMEKVCYHYAGFNNRFLCHGRKSWVVCMEAYSCPHCEVGLR